MGDIEALEKTFLRPSPAVIRMKPLLVYGSATHDNAGDLAMMHSLFRTLSDNEATRNFALLTRNPRESAACFGIHCIASHDPWLIAPQESYPSRLTLLMHGFVFAKRFWAWRSGNGPSKRRLVSAELAEAFDNLSTCRGLLVHGSGSFNSIFRRGWLYPKCFTALVAGWAGIPVWMTSQGIGPFEHPLDRWVAGLFLRRAKVVGVRDGRPSKAAALQCGARAQTLVHTGDDALRLPSASEEEIQAAWKLEGLPEDHSSLFIGVNARRSASYSPSYHDQGEASLAHALDRVSEISRAHVVFIPTTYDRDDDDRVSASAVRKLMRHANRATVITRPHAPAVLRGLVAKMDIAVGASYHFLLFALDAAIPCVALGANSYFRAKHAGLREVYGAGLRTTNWSRDDGGKLARIITETIEARDRIREELQKNVSEPKSRALCGQKEFLQSLSQIASGTCAAGRIAGNGRRKLGTLAACR
jgi:polysaccharide pyruvyl transferase WcaK-like protein